jgi:acyl dehydratase
MSQLYLEDLEPGTRFVSPGRTVTEADVVAFAGLSGDFNPIHTDAVVAERRVGGRIAHGMLVMAMSSGLGQRFVDRVQTIALLEVKKWSFDKPVFFGDTIHLESTVVSSRPTSDGRRGIVEWRREIVNQHDITVQTGIVTNMVASRPAGSES